MRIYYKYNIKLYNTFRLDCIVDYFIIINTVKDLINFMLNDNNKNKLKLIIGNGSNILFINNIKGIVIKLNFMWKKIISNTNNYIFVKFGSGIIWDDVVKWCIYRKIYGLENLSYIPGTVGGAVAGNIGAYGVEVSNFIYEVIVYDILIKNVIKLTNIMCGFLYRNSIFNTVNNIRYIIISVIFKLNKNKKLNLLYLRNKKGININELYSLKRIRKIIITIRKKGLPNYNILGNCGSFFKNILLPINDLNKNKLLNYNLLYNKYNFNTVKILTGYLIEKLGWKGIRYNNVGIYKKQSLVLVKYKYGTGKDILLLSDMIIKDIKDNYDLFVTKEVHVI